MKVLSWKDGVQMDITVVDHFAKSIIKEAGHKIRHSFFGSIEIDTKSNANDLVTSVDRAIEQFFILTIQSQYPTHRVLGEEGYGNRVEALDGVVWIVDPIDGTMNFVHQKRNFAISVGIYVDGVGELGYIYDVMNDELYAARKDYGAYLNDERLPRLRETEVHDGVLGLNARWLMDNQFGLTNQLIELIRDCRGTRSYGSAALEIAYVATGRLNGYISFGLSPWDIAGGVVIAREVGAIATTHDGSALSFLRSEPFIVANTTLHDALLERFAVKIK